MGVPHLETPNPAAMSRRSWAWWTALAAPVVLGPPWVLLAASTGLDNLLGTVVGLVTGMLLIVVSSTDLMRHRIPNWATYPAFSWGLALNAYGSLAAAEWLPNLDRLGGVGLLSSVLGAGLCFLILLFIFQLAGGGAGDVKLATALGALLGAEQAISMLVFTYVIGGTLTICWAVWTVGPVLLLKSVGRRIGAFVLPMWIRPPSAEQERLLKRPIPLALFFALGTLPLLLGWKIAW